jgi:hypothetical protein
MRGQNTIRQLLIVSALWALMSGGVVAATPASASSQFELGPWQAYLVEQITPQLERLERPATAPVSWLQLDQALVAPEFARGWVQPSRSLTSGSVRVAWVQPRWGVEQAGRASLLGAERARIEQSMMMPSVTTQVSDHSVMTVSAVLATQRFVNPGMNLMAYEGILPATSEQAWFDGERVESSHGVGLRVASQFEPFKNVFIETSYRSRIDMNPLANLQGVHGAQAQLDIPSRFEAQINWQIGARVMASVGARHIFYSEVGAFPSRAMPARFSSLLGDSTSPEFAWRDLSVLTAGLGVRLTEQLSAYVEYNSRAQPTPTSKALADALGQDLGKHAWRVALTERMTQNSRVHFSAAYAPPEYVFGGNVLGVVSDDLKQSLEVQAMWQVFF